MLFVLFVRTIHYLHSVYPPSFRGWHCGGSSTRFCDHREGCDHRGGGIPATSRLDEAKKTGGVRDGLAPSASSIREYHFQEAAVTPPPSVLTPVRGFLSSCGWKDSQKKEILTIYAQIERYSRYTFMLRNGFHFTILELHIIAPSTGLVIGYWTEGWPYDYFTLLEHNT